MKRTILTAVLVLSSLLVLTAQNYVTLHEDCSYGGKTFYLEPGSYRDYQMKIGNDKLSSFQVPYGFKITLYENNNFGGRSQTFTSSVTCLDAQWNDMASSIVVEGTGYNQGNQNDYVTFYNDTYHRGYSQSLRPGVYSGAQLGQLKYNISSFQVSGSLRVRLYINNENNSGYSATYTTSQSYLPSSENDKIGSVTIEYYNGGNNNGGGGYGNQSYATFYTECNSNGNALRLMPGYYSGEKLGLFRNNISSVQIPSNLVIKAFSNDNLYGQSTQITESSNCLDYNLRNRIGSVVVEERSGYGGGGGYPGGGNEAVIIYSDENYRGQSASLLPGVYSTMSQASGFPDNALSSIQVPAGYRVVLYEFENFGGKSYTVTNSKTGFLFSNWNDKASSIKVYRE
ncbi:MAG: hypothetical protein JNM88_03660 [Chitinophagaceae bacterium]|nr:hypothetical protein [Chitinophagaceae bacterium]